MNSKAFDQETIKKILAADNEISDESKCPHGDGSVSGRVPLRTRQRGTGYKAGVLQLSLFDIECIISSVQLDLQAKLHMMLDRQ